MSTWTLNIDHWSKHCVIISSDLSLSWGWAEHWGGWWRAASLKKARLGLGWNWNPATNQNNVTMRYFHVQSIQLGKLQQSSVSKFHWNLECNQTWYVLSFDDEIDICILHISHYIPRWSVQRRGGQWNKTGVSAEVNNCLDFGALLGQTWPFIRSYNNIAM